jgi:hypothetical protein
MSILYNIYMISYGEMIAHVPHPDDVTKQSICACINPKWLGTWCDCCGASILTFLCAGLFVGVNNDFGCGPEARSCFLSTLTGVLTPAFPPWVRATREHVGWGKAHPSWLHDSCVNTIIRGEPTSGWEKTLVSADNHYQPNRQLQQRGLLLCHLPGSCSLHICADQYMSQNHKIMWWEMRFLYQCFT